MELTKEQKRMLLITSLHLKSYGKESGAYEIEGSYGDVYSDQKYFHERGLSEIRCPIPDNFREFCVEIYESFDLDSDERHTMSFSIDVTEKVFDIELTEYYLDTEEFGNSFSLEDLEDDESIIDAINLMKQNKIESLEVKYDGSGDSGGIEEWIQQPNTPRITDQVEGLLEDWIYNTLEEYHGGWEINEGSSGSFTFYPNDPDNTVDMNHNMNTEGSETKQILEVNF